MMNGCKNCPAFAKCECTYRGSACAALRSTYGLEDDPEIITTADRDEIAEEILLQMPTIEQPKWISCAERLPRNGEIVFCNTRNYFEVLQWDARADAWVGMYRSYWKEYVTHWMPLPQPPKEDE